ncbi:MAG: hypothetical protein FWH55_01570 [Oscillospiraceae bacterium]|nr:hypothetical protein [Oscillospiraceae bacterium]
MFNLMSHTKESFAKLFECGITPFTTPADIELFMAEALKYGYRTVLSVSNDLEHYKRLLKGSDIKLGGLFAYPSGEMCIESKKCELQKLIEGGCSTVDGVINMSFLMSHEYERLLEETRGLVQFAKGLCEDIEIKFIIECALLNDNDEELIKGSKIIKESGAHYVKMDTGWIPPGGNLRQLKIIREAVGPDFGVKFCGALAASTQGSVAAFETGADIIGEVPVKVIENFDNYKALRQKGVI